MKPTGFKVVVERQDGQITTWHDVLDRKVELIIMEVMKQKGWENGKVTEAYIEFDDNGSYYKAHLDCARLTKVLAFHGFKSNMNALYKTEWFSMKNNPPKEEDACIMVYYEEGSVCHLINSFSYSEGVLLDDDFNKVYIQDNMIWAYYPNPGFD